MGGLNAEVVEFLQALVVAGRRNQGERGTVSLGT